MPRSTAASMRSDPAVYDDEDLDAARAAVRERVGWAPEMALILGSGLGRLAEAADETTVVPAAEIPGYPESTVEGHSGKLVFGALEDTRVVFVQGRVHLYEGYPVQKIAMSGGLGAPPGGVPPWGGPGPKSPAPPPCGPSRPRRSGRGTRPGSQ